jgi:hypothetical protein
MNESGRASAASWNSRSKLRIWHGYVPKEPGTIVSIQFQFGIQIEKTVVQVPIIRIEQEVFLQIMTELLQTACRFHRKRHASHRVFFSQKLSPQIGSLVQCALLFVSGSSSSSIYPLSTSKLSHRPHL